MKKALSVLGVLLVGAVSAQGQDAARAAYQERQALAEVPRLVQQFDQLQSAQEALSTRLSRVEAASRSDEAKGEVAALRADLEELKRRQNALRGEIVKDLMQKLEPLLAKQNDRITAQDARIAAAEKKGASSRPARSASPSDAAPSAPVSPTGKVYNHVVESGQTLSEIARGYGVSLARVLEFNPGLKPERLKVGQTVVVPEK